MKYNPPKVEEYPDTDDTGAPKRKRDESAPELEVPAEPREAKGPPSKAAKPAEETPADEEPELDEEDEVEEDEDQGDIYEEYDQAQDDDEEDEDEGEEEDEVEGVGEAADEGVGDEEDDADEDNTDRPKVHKAVQRFGRAPLDGTPIKQPLTASAEILLAMVIDAMLKSRPISHDLSQRAVNKLLDEGYHDIHKLESTSWEDMTMVLKDGGYNRYREQGATNLGQLAQFLNEKYDGDLNNLWEEAHHDRARTRELIREIKGLGDLGVDLFFNNVQSVWTPIAPFVDGRSLETAEQVGIGSDLDAIYAELEGDALMMSRLANGFRFINIAVGVLMVLGGISQFFPPSMSSIIVGVYVIIFGLLVGGLEFLPNVPDYVYRYASFLFSFLGRGVFYIFVGCILLHDHVLRYIAGSIIGFIGLGYLVLEYIPSIEPPSNMRETEQGWGAEQV
ncbi:COPI associated protein-domain-containing protein [Aspergillus ambiguus]|uniref:TVP15 family protein n=1 Tax=Aspergillus ambiguus TaxID=176160 RepID=UPI003CCCD128